MEGTRDGAQGRSALWLCLKLLGIIVVTHVVVELGLEGGDVPLGELLVATAVLVCVTGPLLWILVVLPLRRAAGAERAATLERESELRAEARRQDFEARLHRAVEMAPTEEATYAVVRRTVERALSEAPVELLIADSSEAHLERPVEAGPDGSGPGCPVVSPDGCPAIRRGQTLVFSSSEELDSCPQLQDRPYGSCSAVCVPVNVAGRSIGVLHAIGPDGQPPDHDRIARLDAVAIQSGARIGLLRVMERTHLQAATDSLTGLLNRRSLESRAYEMLQRREPFALAMGDVDHFKRLNDAHGHEAGDRALRLFARTLRSSLRADDLVCRFGGEEFVIVLPWRSRTEAAAGLQRVSEELLVAIAKGNVPPFTVSYGVTDSAKGTALDEMLHAADLALYRAKQEGRDRIVIAATDPDPDSSAEGQDARRGARTETLHADARGA